MCVLANIGHAAPNVVSLPAPPTAAITQAQNDPAPPDELLETFIVPQTRRAPTGSPRKSGPASSRGRGTPPVVQNRLNGQITYSAFPGLEPLDITMGGDMGGQQVQSHLEPMHLFGGDTLNRNAFRISRGGQGMELGSSSGAVPEAGGGLRLFRPVDGRNGALGLGLYQRLGASGLSLIPGVDTQWHPGKALSLDLALAADSSLRLTQGSQIRGWAVQSFFGWDARQGQSQQTLSLARQWHGTSLFQRLSRSSGAIRGFSWEQGLSQRIGPANLFLDVSRSRLAGDSLQQTRLGLFRPLGRNLLSVRWERDNAVHSGSSQRSAQLAGTLLMPQRNGTLIFLSDTLLSQSGSPSQHQTTVSASWQLGRLWDLQTGLSRDWRSGRERVSAAAGLWVTPQWQARLLVGPNPLAEAGDRQPPLVGFQLVHRFGLTTFASGTVRGRILLNGQPTTQPLQIQMEDRLVRTDRQGRFQFDHVPVGPHDVGFDLSALPATLDAAEMSRSVQVQQGKTVDLVLSAQQVGLVRGRVEVDADAFGQTDLTAGLGIVITDGQGHETTTNADHSFTLGSLPFGKHTISLLSSSLPPGYDIVGSGEREVEVAAGTGGPAEVFRIAPHRQQIEMNTLTP